MDHYSIPQISTASRKYLQWIHRLDQCFTYSLQDLSKNTTFKNVYGFPHIDSVMTAQKAPIILELAFQQVDSIHMEPHDFSEYRFNDLLNFCCIPQSSKAETMKDVRT